MTFRHSQHKNGTLKSDRLNACFQFLEPKIGSLKTDRVNGPFHIVLGSGFLPGIFLGKICCYANFFVILIFLLFSDQISGGKSLRGGKTASKGAPPAPLWKKARAESIFGILLHHDVMLFQTHYKAPPETEIYCTKRILSELCK